MEYSKEDLMEAKKQIWGVGENMGTEESKKSGRRTHAKQSGFTNLRWYTDDGFSGANFFRQGKNTTSVRRDRNSVA